EGVAARRRDPAAFGQSLADAVPRGRRGRADRAHARRDRRRSPAFRDRADRGRDAGEQRRRDDQPASSAQVRRRLLAGRFRHRILVLGLRQAAAGAAPQDRPKLRPPARARWPGRGDRARRDRPRTQPGSQGHRGGRRDRRAAAPAAGARMRRGAGRPDQPAAAGRSLPRRVRERRAVAGDHLLSGAGARAGPGEPFMADGSGQGQAHDGVPGDGTRRSIMSGEQAQRASEADGGAAERAPLWWRLRARLQGRPDTEHEQILVRVAISTAIVSGLAIAAVGEPRPPEAMPLLALAICFFTGSLLLLLHLLFDPAPRPARRYLGMSLDLLTLTLGLLIGQGTAALFYPFYLWITLGMGFRYGRRYLLVSALASALSFALVIAVTEYWRANPALAAGLWAALVVLPAYALSLLTKLTDALARAEEANRAKSRFLATMSHELRTPLRAIIGMADLLRASPLRAEQLDMIRTVRSAGQTLLEMIGDLLDVAKIESGTMTVQPAPFDLHVLLATVRSLLHHQARDKGLELRLSVDPAVPYGLHGAARSLQQILVNLVTNAIKFTDAGSVTIKVLAEAVEPDRVMLRIDVQDTGIGIPLRAQEHIFERFAQVDESATRRHGGTGLGLAIARQLANLMGGLLLVDSTPGVGSCFTFRAPFGRTSEAERRLAGSVVVVGEPAHTAGYLERVSAWGASASSAARPEQVQAALARGGRPPALLFVDSRQWPLDLAALRTCVAVAEGEPPNVVLVTSRVPADRDAYLTILPVVADDDHLFAALHAALAHP